MQTSGDNETQKPPLQPPEKTEPLVYSKPKLRRYDQVEQVKPYGPSERKAG